MIYKIKGNKVFITDIFDTIQDPVKTNRNNKDDLMLNEPNEKLIRE